MPRDSQQSPAQTGARLHFRVRPEVKEKIEKAALLRGQTLTSFSEAVLLEQAEAVLANEERLVVSERAFQGFLTALEHPGEPTPELLAAVERYKQR